MVMHDAFVYWSGHSLRPMKHAMLGFGTFLFYTGWAFVVALPVAIGLGELWWNDRKRYIPHILLLLALSIWSISAWRSHPDRTLLLVTCCWATLPMRWLIDRSTRFSEHNGR